MTPKLGKDGRYHIVYRTHNLINGKEYTGKHSTNNLDDGYYGSGVALNNAVAKYGLENFAVEILSFHDSSDDALFEEYRIVNEEYIEKEDTYNQTLGGIGGNGFIRKNKATVRYKNNNTYFLVDINDPQYLSGELVGTTYNTVIVKDSNNESLRVELNDPRYLSGELVHICSKMVPVKDKDGNTMQVSIDDPRYLSGELVHTSKGKMLSSLHKEKISKSKTGISLSTNHRKNISEAMTGNILSDEHKKKISIGNKGKKISDELLISHYIGENNPFFGKKHNNITKSKMSNSSKDRCWIHNLLLRQNKRIKNHLLSHYIKDGWLKGRKKFNLH